MKTISVEFSKAKAWYKIASDVIATTEKRPYSHAYLKYECPITGILMVSQASKGSVNEITYENFLKENIVIEEIKLCLTEDQILKILKKAKSKQGDPYANDQLLNIAFKKIFRHSLNKTNGEKAVICSEHVVRCLQEVDMYFARDCNIDEITPSDLFKSLKETNWIKLS